MKTFKIGEIKNSHLSAVVLFFFTISSVISPAFAANPRTSRISIVREQIRIAQGPNFPALLAQKRQLIQDINNKLQKYGEGSMPNEQDNTYGELSRNLQEVTEPNRNEWASRLTEENRALTRRVAALFSDLKNRTQDLTTVPAHLVGQVDKMKKEVPPLLLGVEKYLGQARSAALVFLKKQESIIRLKMGPGNAYINRHLGAIDRMNKATSSITLFTAVKNAQIVFNSQPPKLKEHPLPHVPDHATTKKFKKAEQDLNLVLSQIPDPRVTFLTTQIDQAKIAFNDWTTVLIEAEGNFRNFFDEYQRNREVLLSQLGDMTQRLVSYRDTNIEAKEFVDGHEDFVEGVNRDADLFIEAMHDYLTHIARTSVEIIQAMIDEYESVLASIRNHEPGIGMPAAFAIPEVVQIDAFPSGNPFNKNGDVDRRIAQLEVIWTRVKTPYKVIYNSGDSDGGAGLNHVAYNGERSYEVFEKEEDYQAALNELGVTEIDPVDFTYQRAFLFTDYVRGSSGYGVSLSSFEIRDGKIHIVVSVSAAEAEENYLDVMTRPTFVMVLNSRDIPVEVEIEEEERPVTENPTEDLGDGMDYVDYERIGGWLVSNGYYSDLTSALTYARTGYIGHDNEERDPFYWNLRQPVTFQIVEEEAGFANDNLLGYYTGSGDHKLLNQIFGGRENGPSRLPMDQPFGLYLKTPYDTWYTAQSENTSQQKQALIYELKPGEEWFVAWEDMNAGVDSDFNDMHLFVTTNEPTEPQPEPQPEPPPLPIHERPAGCRVFTPQALTGDVAQEVCSQDELNGYDKEQHDVKNLTNEVLNFITTYLSQHDYTQTVAGIRYEISHEHNGNRYVVWFNEAIGDPRHNDPPTASLSIISLKETVNVAHVPGTEKINISAVVNAVLSGQPQKLETVGLFYRNTEKHTLCIDPPPGVTDFSGYGCFEREEPFRPVAMDSPDHSVNYQVSLENLRVGSYEYYAQVFDRAGNVLSTTETRSFTVLEPPESVFNPTPSPIENPVPPADSEPSPEPPTQTPVNEPPSEPVSTPIAPVEPPVLAPPADSNPSPEPLPTPTPEKTFFRCELHSSGFVVCQAVPKETVENLINHGGQENQESGLILCDASNENCQKVKDLLAQGMSLNPEIIKVIGYLRSNTGVSTFYVEVNKRPLSHMPPGGSNPPTPRAREVVRTSSTIFSPPGTNQRFSVEMIIEHDSSDKLRLTVTSLEGSSAGSLKVFEDAVALQWSDRDPYYAQRKEDLLNQGYVLIAEVRNENYLGGTAYFARPGTTANPVSATPGSLDPTTLDVSPAERFRNFEVYDFYGGGRGWVRRETATPQDVADFETRALSDQSKQLPIGAMPFVSNVRCNAHADKQSKACKSKFQQLEKKFPDKPFESIFGYWFTDELTLHGIHSTVYVQLETDVPPGSNGLVSAPAPVPQVGQNNPWEEERLERARLYDYLMRFTTTNTPMMAAPPNLFIKVTRNGNDRYDRIFGFIYQYDSHDPTEQQRIFRILAVTRNGRILIGHVRVSNTRTDLISLPSNTGGISLPSSVYLRDPQGYSLVRPRTLAVDPSDTDSLVLHFFLTN